MSDDRIHIEQLEIDLNVGVPELERARPQRLLLNITLTPATAFRELGEDLGRTIDYAAVCQAVTTSLRGRSFKLIETVADETALLIKRQAGVQRVEVEVRKFILPQTAYVAVRTTR
ncbi:MAG TPA: dihydroneopterin aldolase [Chthoniobacterales bacterium]|nr:dihydroneopterin aldolase [Chthoniobacterales bacterium]